MHKFLGIILLFSLLVSISGCSLAGDITPPPGSELPVLQSTSQPVVSSPVYPIIPPNLTDGEKIYKEKCTQCHGARGLGDGPQAAQLSVPVASLGLADLARQNTPARWYSVVSQGNMEKFMPAFQNLTDRQRWDVVAYAMSLSNSDQIINLDKALYESNCLNCHGALGDGRGADAETLSTPPTNFTDQSIMAETSAADLFQAVTNGISPDMPAYSATLDDPERWSLVSYLRSLTFTSSLATGNADVPPIASNAVQLTTATYPEPVTYPSPVITPTPVVTTTAVVSPAVTFIGTVTVQLINGSGGTPPSDAPVTLYGFDEMQNTYSETLTTGESGFYTFTNVIMPEGRVFLAGTNYSSGTYGSDIATVNPATPNLNLQITVYDSTTDVSVLTTDRVHIFFDFTDPQNAQVIEVFIISNPTKQAVVSPSADGPVVNFPLPQGYTNLQFQDGEIGSRYVELSQGFADKMTVSPGVGQYQVVFAFQMPYDHSLKFTQPMFLPTSAVLVLVPDNGIKLNSSMLQDGGTRDYQGTSYRMFNGGSLLAGSTLDFTLSGRPKLAPSPLFTTGTMQNLAIGIGVFGVALVGVGIWLFRRNRHKLGFQQASPGDDIAAPVAVLDDSLGDEDTLMDGIIALDDQYHAGNLPQEAYLERRAALKEKLKKLEQG